MAYTRKQLIAKRLIVSLPGISERRVLSPSRIASTIAEIIVLTAEKEKFIQRVIIAGRTLHTNISINIRINIKYKYNYKINIISMYTGRL